MSTQVIRPARNFQGSVTLPGDKSISHRYAMLAGLAEGTTRLSNFSTGADPYSSLACMAALGATVNHKSDQSIEITGTAGHFIQPEHPLDCGNSGSTMRMLAGLLAGQQVACTLVGDESLSRRPMRRVIEPLVQMGADISGAANGFPPLRLAPGGRLKGVQHRLAVASAQVKTALLFAGLAADGRTSVEEPLRTRDHGELALRSFGAEVTRSRNLISIDGGQALRAIEAYVPGDISSAAFFLCAVAILPGSSLLLDDVLLNPTRAVLLDVLAGMGMPISMIKVEESHGELVGTIKAEHGRLRGARIAGAQSAALIDELPVLAAIAPYTREGIEIRDARELRVKESDRIAVVAENLRRMGATVEEFEDGLRVPGAQPLHGAALDAAGDHRIAMAFSIAALGAEGETTIRGAESASISFPEFFATLDRLVER